MPETAQLPLCVLVVEDDPLTRRTVETVLGRIGIDTVLTAENGAAALAVLAATEDAIDLVICDIEMPEMTGYELVRRLRYGTVPRFKDVPVLMLTAHDTPKNLQRARTHRIAGFLVKPATAESLRLAIRDALKHH